MNCYLLILSFSVSMKKNVGASEYVVYFLMMFLLSEQRILSLVNHKNLALILASAVAVLNDFVFILIFNSHKRIKTPVKGHLCKHYQVRVPCVKD